jgi:hypothetical protein
VFECELLVTTGRLNDGLRIAIVYFGLCTQRRTTWQLCTPINSFIHHTVNSMLPCRRKDILSTN